MNTAAGPFMVILLAWFLVILGAPAAAQPPPPPQGCFTELVNFSPCLPYVSSPPNNLSDTVPPKCCTAFSSSLDSGGALCLCYLIQDPWMLGFPVNDTRVLSLSSSCPLSISSSSNSNSATNTSSAAAHS